MSYRLTLECNSKPLPEALEGNTLGGFESLSHRMTKMSHRITKMSHRITKMSRGITKMSHRITKMSHRSKKKLLPEALEGNSKLLPEALEGNSKKRSLGLRCGRGVWFRFVVPAQR